MKITNHHIALYKRVGGDTDHLQRIGTAEEKSLENQNVIHQIGEFVADLIVVKNGFASSGYTNKIYDKMRECCTDESVIEQIKQLESHWS